MRLLLLFSADNRIELVLFWLFNGAYCRSMFILTDIGDRLIEVVGLENTIHVAQVKGGIQSGKRLAQCSNVVIRFDFVLCVKFLIVLLEVIPAESRR
jgi:hypothetical protein